MRPDVEREMNKLPRREHERACAALVRLGAAFEF
jgi:hypothetical protein